MATDMNEMSFIEAKYASRGLPLKPAGRKSIETLVVRAYFELILIAWGNEGSRSVLLTKHGTCEVRLLEKLPFNATQTPSLWVDLYDADTRVLIDTCLCGDLEAATVAAEDFIKRARSLAEDEDGDQC
jgi:hypothetical protein